MRGTSCARAACLLAALLACAAAPACSRQLQQVTAPAATVVVHDRVHRVLWDLSYGEKADCGWPQTGSLLSMQLSRVGHAADMSAGPPSPSPPPACSRGRPCAMLAAGLSACPLTLHAHPSLPQCRMSGCKRGAATWSSSAGTTPAARRARRWRCSMPLPAPMRWVSARVCRLVTPHACCAYGLCAALNHACELWR